MDHFYRHAVTSMHSTIDQVVDRFHQTVANHMDHHRRDSSSSNENSSSSSNYNNNNGADQTKPKTLQNDSRDSKDSSVHSDGSGNAFLQNALTVTRNLFGSAHSVTGHRSGRHSGKQTHEPKCGGGRRSSAVGLHSLKDQQKKLEKKLASVGSLMHDKWHRKSE